MGLDESFDGDLGKAARSRTVGIGDHNEVFAGTELGDVGETQRGIGLALKPGCVQEIGVGHKPLIGKRRRPIGGSGKQDIGSPGNDLALRLGGNDRGLGNGVSEDGDRTSGLGIDDQVGTRISVKIANSAD